MAGQYGGDAQMLAAAVTLVTTAETNILSTGFVTIPYETGKFYISGMLYITTGTGVTGVQVRCRRNVNAENVVLGVAAQTIVAGASTTLVVPFDFTDPIPDNRPCQYTVTVQQVGATGNGSVLANSTISSTLFSG